MPWKSSSKNKKDDNLFDVGIKRQAKEISAK